MRSSALEVVPYRRRSSPLNGEFFSWREHVAAPWCFYRAVALFLILFFVAALRPLQECHSCAPKSSSVKAGAIMKLRKRKQSAQHGSFGARATSRARVAANQHSLLLFCLHACLVVCACVAWRTAAIRSSHASSIYLPFGPFWGIAGASFRYFSQDKTAVPSAGLDNASWERGDQSRAVGWAKSDHLLSPFGV